MDNEQEVKPVEEAAVPAEHAAEATEATEATEEHTA